MDTQIPFSGFYESHWDYEIDQAEENLVNYLLGEEDSGEGVEGFKGVYTAQQLHSALFFVMSYKKVHGEIAKKYAEYFALDLDKACGWEVGLTFDEMTSPREYNFTTDRIFMKIPEESVKRMFEECDKGTLAMIAAQNFTSRSGFISHYSPDVEAWGDVSEWDHNQVYTLLEAWIASRELDVTEDEIREDMSCNGDFSNAVDNAYVTEELLARLKKDAA